MMLLYYYIYNLYQLDLLFLLVNYYYKDCKTILIHVLEVKSIKMRDYMSSKNICVLTGSASIRTPNFYLLVHSFSQFDIQR